MEITTKKELKAVIISCKGRMDAVSTPEFDKVFDELVAKGESAFIVNMGALEYISSAGLRSVLAAAKTLKTKNGKLSFASLKGPVKEVFELSGFYSIFKIYDSEEAAMKEM